MKYYLIIIILFLIFLNIANSQDTTNKKNTGNTNIQLNTENALKHDVNVTLTKNEDDFWSKYFPSILIAVIGVITIVANYITTKIQIKNETKISSEQLNSALLDIKNQKEIAEKQMKYEFVSNKRHIWIDDFRNAISEFISHAVSIANLDVDNLLSEKIETKMNRIVLLQYKIELLLDPSKKDKHKEIIKEMNKIFITSANILESYIKKTNNDVIIKEMMKDIKKFVEDANKLIKEAWAKVKSGE